MKKLKQTTKTKNKNREDVKLGILILIFVFAVCLSLIIRNSQTYLTWESNYLAKSNLFFKTQGVAKFDSEQNFKDYLKESEGLAGLGWGGGNARAMGMEMGEDFASPTSEEKTIPERISETNIQVTGIDEPDIVKTDGNQIYFSSPSYYYDQPRPFIDVQFESSPDNINRNKINIINAWPPADLEIDAEIEKTGSLLLSNNILIIFSGQEILGYDVSNPADPIKKWESELEENTYLVTARLYNDQIYLVTSSRINSSQPCPIKPLVVNGDALNIACNDIYYPLPTAPVDSTYTAMKMDVQSGEINEDISFVGSYYSSVVYMSENAIYITYNAQVDTFGFTVDFFATKAKSLVSVDFINKLQRLNSYDIGLQAKMVEFSTIFSDWMLSLDDDERLLVNNELENLMSDYVDAHKRELSKTGIIKIDLNLFNIKSNGEVPGTPLNQFSLDEYEDHLRIATTIGGQNSFIFSNGESGNDVYILDKNLTIEGEVKDLGQGERIYSVRFIQDKGYLVTFRQIDPFYVLDLSNPSNPSVKGELKIPGYSSYLHPINKNKILGIGKEDSQVKISYFNVSNPSNPTEIDKYILDEYWSEVLSTHHAFLLDPKHEVFFLPGGQGGYVFSYEDNELKLVKAISQNDAQRAIYLDDYLYIISNQAITVFNENDWTEVNSLDLLD